MTGATLGHFHRGGLLRNLQHDVGGGGGSHLHRRWQFRLGKSALRYRDRVVARFQQGKPVKAGGTGSGVLRGASVSICQCYRSIGNDSMTWIPDRARDVAGHQRLPECQWDADAQRQHHQDFANDKSLHIALFLFPSMGVNRSSEYSVRHAAGIGSLFSVARPLSLPASFDLVVVLRLDQTLLLCIGAMHALYHVPGAGFQGHRANCDCQSMASHKRGGNVAMRTVAAVSAILSLKVRYQAKHGNMQRASAFYGFMDERVTSRHARQRSRKLAARTWIKKTMKRECTTKSTFQRDSMPMRKHAYSAAEARF